MELNDKELLLLIRALDKKLWSFIQTGHAIGEDIVYPYHDLRQRLLLAERLRRMSVKEIKTDEATCDGCGKRQVGPLGDGVYGIHGSAVEYAEDGGRSVEWFACTMDCVAEAIARRLSGAAHK